jgi:hypothetical protein
MVDARELLSPWLPFAHALSVNAENRDLRAFSLWSARSAGC